MDPSPLTAAGRFQFLGESPAKTLVGRPLNDTTNLHSEMIGYISLRRSAFSDMTVSSVDKIIVAVRPGDDSNVAFVIAPDRLRQAPVRQNAHSNCDPVDTHDRRKRVVHARRQSPYRDLGDLKKREHSILVRSASSPERKRGP